MDNIYPILAIDYGKKHFGLSISDNKGIIASPLEVLSITKNRNIKIIIQEISEICKEYNIKSILIGQPQVFSENQNRSKKNIDHFSRLIKENTNIPILFQDESFSTTEAQNMLRFSGQNIKNTRNKIDKIAATVFLQEFLNSKKKRKWKITTYLKCPWL